MRCRICRRSSLEVRYEGAIGQSLTSVMGVMPIDLKVFVCRDCGHIQNGDLPDDRVDGYYENEYDYLLDSEESQEVCFGRDGEQQRRMSMLFAPFADFLARVPAGRCLDFGCGKGLTIRALKQRFPDWEISAYDVSERYRPFLEKHIERDKLHLGLSHDLFAMEESFNVISLFYVLEHISDPVPFLGKIKRLLRQRGYLYISVPEICRGELDWLIIDHLSHFSLEKMVHLCARAGLKVIQADDFQASASLHVICQRVDEHLSRAMSEVQHSTYHYNSAILEGHTDYFARFSDEVRRAIACCRETNRKMAVFGTGTAASAVPVLHRESIPYIACFLDENPHRIGTMHHGRPVIAPTALPPDLALIFLGVTRANVRHIRGRFSNQAIPLFAVEW